MAALTEVAYKQLEATARDVELFARCVLEQTILPPYFGLTPCPFPAALKSTPAQACQAVYNFGR